MSSIDIPNACTTSANESVGTTSLEAASCNLGHLDRVSNSSALTSTNRLGRVDPTIAGLNAQAQAIFADAGGVLLGDGVYGVGIEYTNRNQYLIDAGIPYKVRSTVTLPYTTTTATAIADANLQPFNEVSNSDLTTLLEQTLGAGSSLYIGSDNDINAVVAENNTVPAGTTHLRVPINGNPEIVAISPTPSAGGVITLLTESGCSIGGIVTVFIPSFANNNNVLTSGASAIYRNLRERFNEVVNILDHGASTVKTATENSAAITNAVTYANSLGHPVTFVIPQGAFNINRIDLDLPNGSHIECFGNFISEISGDTAIFIGSSNRNVFWLEVRGIRVNRSTADVTSGSIGVRLENLVWCKVDVRSVTGYQDGVYCIGSQGNGGFSYNTISLGQLHDNRNNLHLTASNGLNGYCNENVFEQGGFNHSSGYPNVTTTNILIDHHAENELNNNRFIAPSFEDNSSIAIAATINGNNNIIMFPRMENPAIQSTYKIQFTAQSSECQIIGAGFFLVSDNVEDLGVNNAYETRNGRVISHQTPDTSTDAVFSAQSTVSNNARAFAAKGTSGGITGYIRCDGMYFSPNTGYFESGVRMSTSDGTLIDFGVFTAAANPEGNITAGAGSICLSKNGNVYRKQSGSGNVGWGLI